MAATDEDRTRADLIDASREARLSSELASEAAEGGSLLTCLIATQDAQRARRRALEAYIWLEMRGLALRTDLDDEDLDDLRTADDAYSSAVEALEGMGDIERQVWAPIGTAWVAIVTMEDGTQVAGLSRHIATAARMAMEAAGIDRLRDLGESGGWHGGDRGWQADPEPWRTLQVQGPEDIR